MCGLLYIFLNTSQRIRYVYVLKEKDIRTKNINIIKY